MKIRIHRCIELVHIPYITAQITQSKFLQTGPLENYRSARRHVLEYSQSLRRTQTKTRSKEQVKRYISTTNTIYQGSLRYRKRARRKEKEETT